MKKIYIALAVLATAALTSCEQEKSFNDGRIGKNDLVISMQGAPSTRSMKTGVTLEKGETIELGKDEDGNTFFLEETIQDLNAAWAPVTKGTPAYTENVGVLYEELGVYAGGSSNYNFYSMDYPSEGAMVGGGWRYAGEFSWAQDAYDFYFWMPKTDNGITETPTYGKTANDLSITFAYQTPNTAAAQKDLIFAARNITKAEAQGDYRINGVPVLFNHALTGVKFAIANYDSSKKITIKSVSFKGLYDTGSCLIKPAKENEYRDEKDTYSSGDGRVIWPAPNTTLSKSKRLIESGDFSENGPVNFESGSFENNGDYPDSFSAAGNENNLNDTDASQTFWLIPQAMTADITLFIVYTFGNDTEQTWEIAFGEVLAEKNVVWKAGELRTYTIKIDDVNVKIEDKVTATATDGVELKDEEGKTIVDPDTGEPYTFTAYGGTKNNVVITNTGNTDAYIRAGLIGQWLDEDGNPVFGFTDYTAGKVKLVDSWYQDQFVKTTPGKHGTFVGLPGYKGGTNPLNNWKLQPDGYYYYTVKVPAGEAVPNPLFTSYTVGDTPAVLVAGEVKTVYFVLEVATQAVSAKKLDGSDYTWEEAWARTKAND